MEELKFNTTEISIETAYKKYYPSAIVSLENIIAFKALFCAGKRQLIISNQIGFDSSYIIEKRGRRYYISQYHYV